MHGTLSAIGGVGSSVSRWTRSATPVYFRLFPSSSSHSPLRRIYCPLACRKLSVSFISVLRGYKRVARMSSRMEWMLVVLGLIVLAGSGSALRCWDCASNMNSMCGDPINVTDHQATFHTKICGAGPYETSKSICRKIVRRENGERVVIRQCSTPNVDEADIVDGPCSSMAMSGRNAMESCHICSTDLCNSATGVSAMNMLYVGALAIVGYGYLQSK